MSRESVLQTAWYLLNTNRYCCPFSKNMYFHPGDLESSPLERSQLPICRKQREETIWFPLKGLTEEVCMILGIYFQSMLWQATSDHPSEEAGLPHSTDSNKLQYFQWPCLITRTCSYLFRWRKAAYSFMVMLLAMQGVKFALVTLTSAWNNQMVQFSS